jgi:hypothetical protein
MVEHGFGLRVRGSGDEEPPLPLESLLEGDSGVCCGETGPEDEMRKDRPARGLRERGEVLGEVLCRGCWRKKGKWGKRNGGGDAERGLHDIAREERSRVARGAFITLRRVRGLG